MEKIISILLLLGLAVFVTVFVISTVKDIITLYKKRKQKNVEEVKKDNDGSIE